MKYTLQLFIAYITLVTACHGMDQQPTPIKFINPLRIIPMTKKAYRAEYINNHEIIIRGASKCKTFNLITNQLSHKTIDGLNSGSDFTLHPNNQLIAIFTN